MRFSVMLPQSNRIASPQALIDVAQAAEELGFDAVSVRDHIVFNGAYVTSGMRGIDLPGDDRNIFEALETLAFVASRTTRIRLGTSVIILPNRHPLLLAKQTSSLDVLSGGRLLLGLGIGPNRQETASDTTLLGAHRTNLVREYDSFGAFGPRGPRADEYFEAMRLIWTEERPSFHGKYVDFDEVEIFPKPIQLPHPPIVVGGRSPRARERAVRWGAGWLPSQVTADEIREGATHLQEMREAEGSVPADPILGINVHSSIADSDAAALDLLETTVGRHFADRAALLDRTVTGDPAEFTRRVIEYGAAGVDYIELKPVCRSIDHLIEQLRRIQQEVMPVAAAG
jgi:probable F420-dependent oxidoreductase